MTNKAPILEHWIQLKAPVLNDRLNWQGWKSTINSKEEEAGRKKKDSRERIQNSTHKSWKKISV